MLLVPSAALKLMSSLVGTYGLLFVSALEGFNSKFVLKQGLVWIYNLESYFHSIAIPSASD